MRQQSAYKAHRGESLSACPIPPCPNAWQSLWLCLTSMTSYSALSHGPSCRRPSSTTHTPGMGQILRVVLLYASHEITRCPRVQDCVVLVPLGQRRPGISGEAVWHRRHAARQCGSPMGLLGSGSPLPPYQSGGPTVSGPLREKTRQGESVDGLGSSARPGGLLKVERGGRV